MDPSLLALGLLDPRLMSDRVLERRGNRLLVLDAAPDRFLPAFELHSDAWLREAVPLATLDFSECSDPLCEATLRATADRCRRGLAEGHQILIRVTAMQKRSFEEAESGDLAFRVVDIQLQSTDSVTPPSSAPGDQENPPLPPTDRTPPAHPTRILPAAASVDELEPDENQNITLFLTNMPDFDDVQAQTLTSGATSSSQTDPTPQMEDVFERRGSLRQDVENVLIYFQQEPGQPRWQGPALNLSARGVQFITDQNLEVGNMVTVALDFRNRIQRHTSQAQVIWNRQVYKHGQKYFQVGARFIDPPRPFREALHEHASPSEPT